MAGHSVLRTHWGMKMNRFSGGVFKKLLVVDVISQAHADIIYHGIVRSGDPEEDFMTLSRRMMPKSMIRAAKKLPVLKE